MERISDGGLFKARPHLRSDRKGLVPAKPAPDPSEFRLWHLGHPVLAGAADRHRGNEARIRSGLRPLGPTPAPSVHPLWDVRHPVLTSARTGRDWSPRSLPQTHPNYASGIWDTLSSLALGQGGIRTLGWLSPTHAFQACPIDRSGTCPRTKNDKWEGRHLRADKL